MSAVLDIDNLLESPLADLHALAGELDIEDYRLLRKPDLTIAILESRGATADQIRPAVETKAAELAKIKAEHEAELIRQDEEREQLEDEAREAAAAERATREPRSQRSGERGSSRGQRGGRGRGGRGERRPSNERSSERGGDRKPRERSRGEDTKTAAVAEGGRGRGRGKKEDAPKSDEPTVAINGVFEPGSGGGGRLRTDLSRRVRGDADVPRGEVRRWNLQRGDLIVAEARKARRGRTDFVIATITTVNGQDQQARKQKTPSFSELPAAAIGERFAKKLFKAAPIGAGSRAVVTGPTRAAASEMLLKLAGEIASDGAVTTLVLVAARPEQATTGDKFAVVTGAPGKPPEDIAPALELVLDRDRRLAESGRNTALLIDGLDLLPPDKASEIFNAARNLEQQGSVTIVASAGAGSPLEAQATSIGVVAGGRRLKLDKKSSWSQ
jgi:transcription termination factor Rho